MMNISWRISVWKIRCGKICWTSFTLLIILFVVSSCSSQTKDIKKEPEEHRVLLPDDFYAVGLVYHRFGDDRYPSTNTPLDIFEEQLQYLSNNGFKTYTVSDLYKNAHDSIKKVFITVDDGLKSFYTNGLPLLNKYKCKATLFINTESVGWGDYLSWKQLKDLVKKGVEIGSHSHKHTYFLNTPDSVRVKSFMADLHKSEQLFLDSLGFIPKVYAYPYGEYDEQMANVLKDKGYILAFAQNSGVWSYMSHQYAIPRFSVAGNYVGMQQFKLKVNMKPIIIHPVNSFPINISAKEKMNLELTLDSIHNFNSLNCFFNSALNSDIFQIQNNNIKVHLQMPSESRRVLLTFTARDKENNWYWWSKLLINTEVK